MGKGRFKYSIIAFWVKTLKIIFWMCTNIRKVNRFPNIFFIILEERSVSQGVHAEILSEPIFLTIDFCYRLDLVIEFNQVIVSEVREFNVHTKLLLLA